MIVTIDGPAGAGKSTVSRRLAQRLGFRFLDTGAMYRAVAWAALDAGIPVKEEQRLAGLAAELRLEIQQDRVLVNGRDVTREIRSSRVTDCVGAVADNVEVRRLLADVQRRMGREGNIVTEGRDQGSAVFPDAECKIFLTASAEERARRRLRDLRASGESVSLEQVLDSQNQRDAGDENREIGPLTMADDAVLVVTDGMSLDDVIDHLEAIVRRKRKPA